MSGRIKVLDVSVVNKIAAGEIIISPVNALKEMMENSIDAGANNIEIVVKDGGIKMLKIVDDGCGINKDDLSILCERFTTSKLNKFEDLENIQTYGFRGEALASISHISRLSVTTKTPDDKCAWKVSYSEGKMLGKPEPVAGKTGTIILVEDLFYNIPSRLRSLKSPSDEYSKILDVVGKYAVHSTSTGFSCKKLGESNFTLSVRSQYTRQERIRTVYGNNVFSHLQDYDLENIEQYQVDSVKGQVTNLNFSMKKLVAPIFFINNRLVTCDPLRRSLSRVYSNFLPKGSKPFIYLSLLIDPTAVDVNVHPTKREVRFLHQDEIIEKISMHLSEILSKLETSREFQTTSILTRKPFSSSQPSGAHNTQNSDSSKPVSTLKAKVYEHKMVRTDASQSKITSFLKRNDTASEKIPSPNLKKRRTLLEVQELELNDHTLVDGDIGRNKSGDSIIQRHDGDGIDENESQSQNKTKLPSTSGVINLDLTTEISKDSNATFDSNSEVEDEEVDEGKEKESIVEKEVANDLSDNTSKSNLEKEDDLIEGQYTISSKKRVQVDLTSLKLLKEQVDDNVHKELTRVFTDMTFVGVVDEEKRLAAIQHDLKLFLVDYGALCYELFYQIGLTEFANFGTIALDADIDSELTVSNLLSMFETLADDKNSIEHITSKLWQNKEMLQEYFSIELVNDGDDWKSIKIVTLPLLLKDYLPPLAKLPFFLFRMGTKVNWNNESDCLDGIIKQIALFYIPEILQKVDTTDESISEAVKADFVIKSKKITDTLENAITPCIKRRFLAPTNLLKDVVEIASLPGLYKVFERC